MPAETIEQAEQAGTDELLAIDAVVLPKKVKYTIEELAAKVGTDVEVVRVFWRALGFVDGIEGERSFTKRDVSILKSMVALTEQGLIQPHMSLGVARVIGVSMAQIATALVDASESSYDDRRIDGGDDSNSFAVRAGELLPFMSDVIDYSFHRHLRAAARRRVVLASTVDGATQVIGFADLVRFTELSLQLDDHELADVVGRFDDQVNHTVVRHGGRIVKMIGDGVMFATTDATQAALIALELSRTVADDARLPGLRVGMASGPVMARDGDLYGSVVNLASRLVAFGRAGAINVDQDTRQALAGDSRFVLRSLGNRQLRHIGDVKVHRLRPGPDWTPEHRSGSGNGNGDGGTT